MTRLAIFGPDRMSCVVALYTVWVKKIFTSEVYDIFSQQVIIFKQNFTRLLHVLILPNYKILVFSKYDNVMPY